MPPRRRNKRSRTSCRASCLKNALENTALGVYLQHQSPQRLFLTVDNLSDVFVRHLVLCPKRFNGLFPRGLISQNINTFAREIELIYPGFLHILGVVRLANFFYRVGTHFEIPFLSDQPA